MPMRLRLSRDERRRRLLRAAQEVFGERGYRKTEVEEIVRRAGVTKPMLYRHFPGGKAEVYMEVLDEHLSRMMGKLGEAMASTDVPLEALRRGIDAYLRFAEENPEAFHLLAETSAELDPGIVDRLREVRSSIAAGLADSIGAVLEDAGLGREGAPVYAHVLLGGVESVVSWWLDTKLLDRPAVVTHLLTFLWRGFDGLPRGPARLRLVLSRLGELAPARPATPLSPSATTSPSRSLGWWPSTRAGSAGSSSGTRSGLCGGPTGPGVGASGSSTSATSTSWEPASGSPTPRCSSP